MGVPPFQETPIYDQFMGPFPLPKLLDQDWMKAQPHPIEFDPGTADMCWSHEIPWNPMNSHFLLVKSYKNPISDWSIPIKIPFFIDQILYPLTSSCYRGQPLWLYDSIPPISCERQAKRPARHLSSAPISPSAREDAGACGWTGIRGNLQESHWIFYVFFPFHGQFLGDLDHGQALLGGSPLAGG